jgi:hypothetical protein
MVIAIVIVVAIVIVFVFDEPPWVIDERSGYRRALEPERWFAATSPPAQGAEHGYGDPGVGGIPGITVAGVPGESPIGGVPGMTVAGVPGVPGV